MTTSKTVRSKPVWATLRAQALPAAVKVMTMTAIGLSLAGCRPGEEPGTHVAGWAMIDPAQRHPIVVSKQPANMNIRVARGADGLTPQQRSNVIDFLNRYRGSDQGNSKVQVSVPSGSPNEVAALRAVADLREVLREYGLDDTRVSITPYQTEGDHQPPIKVSYARFVAEAPDCGHWPANIARDPGNLPYHDFGCSTQRNFAAQVANPADLLGPRTMTPAIGERRDTIWDKFIKGESTITKKDADEKNVVKGAQ